MFKQIGLFMFLIHLTSIWTNDDVDLHEYRTMKDGEFPYLVRVKSSKVRCIGTLISYARFVTAGRCFARYDHKYKQVIIRKLGGYAVYAGSAYFFSSNVYGRDVIQCHIHPMFSPRQDHNFHHDIALLDLNRPFPSDDYRVKPMAFMDGTKIKEAWVDVVKKNKTCYTVGWSWNLQECDPWHDDALYLKQGWKHLQVMKVKPMPNETCRKYASSKENMQCLGEVCTEGFNYYNGPCGGDPGSPIICDGQPLGLHMSNLVCSQFEVAHFYQLFWPYTVYFHAKQGFQGFESLSGSNRLMINSFLLFLACICVTLSMLHRLNK